MGWSILVCWCIPQTATGNSYTLVFSLSNCNLDNQLIPWNFQHFFAVISYFASYIFRQVFHLNPDVGPFFDTFFVDSDTVNFFMENAERNFLYLGWVELFIFSGLKDVGWKGNFKCLITFRSEGALKVRDSSLFLIIRKRFDRRIEWFRIGMDPSAWDYPEV